MSAPSETGHATGEEDGPGLTPERSFLVRCSIVCLANVYASDQHRAGGRARIDEPDRSDQTSDPASVARERSGALVVSKPFQPSPRPDLALGPIRVLCVWAASVWLRERGVHAWLRTDHGRNPLSRPRRTNPAEKRPAIARCVCAFVSKKFSRSLVSRP